MMHIGDIINATIVRVEQFGLFVDAAGNPGLLLIPDLSWDRISHPSEIATVNDRIQCKVIRIPPDAPVGEPQFIGSIRALHPERNPWREPSAFAVGNVFSGRVERHMSYGIFILHPRKTQALLHVDDIPPNAHINVGDDVSVVITECNADKQTIRVQLHQP